MAMGITPGITHITALTDTMSIQVRDCMIRTGITGTIMGTDHMPGDIQPLIQLVSTMDITPEVDTVLPCIALPGITEVAIQRFRHPAHLVADLLISLQQLQFNPSIMVRVLQETPTLYRRRVAGVTAIQNRQQEAAPYQVMFP